MDVSRHARLLLGLDAGKAQGLFDKSFLMPTDHVADGLISHSFRNVPHIIAGDAGGYLKQGAYIGAGNVTNNQLFNTLIPAAIRDLNRELPNLGSDTGTGQIAGLLA